MLATVVSENIVFEESEIRRIMIRKIKEQTTVKNLHTV